MKKIFKYQLETTDIQQVEMPQAAEYFASKRKTKRLVFGL